MKIKKQVILLLVLISIGIFMYPAAVDLYSQRHNAKYIDVYTKHISELSEKEFNDIKKSISEFNQNLQEPQDKQKYIKLPETTSDENGVIAYVEVPSLKIKLPVYEGVTDEHLEKGAAHLSSTSYPVGGKDTHTVITAHCGYKGMDMFKDLDLITKDDLFYIYCLDNKLVYRVDSINVVEPHEMQYINIIPNEDYATLLTCTPYGINSFRLLIRGKRVEGSELSTCKPKPKLSLPQKIRCTFKKRTVYKKYLLLPLIPITAIIAAISVKIHKKRKNTDHE